MKVAYPIILTPGQESCLVYVPDLNINTEGRDIADAISMASDAISMCGICLQDMGKEIPAASHTLPSCGEDEIAAFAVVDFDACRRANDMRTVRKSVTLPNYLNELAMQAGVNFSQVLQEGLKQHLGVS